MPLKSEGKNKPQSVDLSRYRSLKWADRRRIRKMLSGDELLALGLIKTKGRKQKSNSDEEEPADNISQRLENANFSKNIRKFISDCTESEGVLDGVSAPIQNELQKSVSEIINSDDFWIRLRHCKVASSGSQTKYKSFLTAS